MDYRVLTETERKYTFSQSQQLSMQTGLIGYLRADFGSNGNEFWTTWNDFRKDLKTDEFKAEFDDVINGLRDGDVLSGRKSMSSYCYSTPDSSFNDDRNHYGIRLDTEKYSYLMRFNPNRGEYNLYCYCYQKEWLNNHLKNAGQDTETVEIAVNDGKPIENKLIYGSVSGKKITENGEELGGAVIGLFKADETVFTKENALMTATSENDGSFSFDKVPYGNWIVREIEQPKGFVLDETSYEVKISEVGQVIEVEIVNEYVHGNIKLTKVDEDYPDNKLTGATFEVYKDVNGDGKLDDGDELIGTLSETSTGIYEMKELLYGKYLVRETKAPEGFELDKGVYSVFIEKDETTYEVENKAGVGFINTAMKGNLKIVKTSSDGKVEGFTFRVTGVNGYDRSFTTDKNGEIIIEGLRIGDYTISEVQDSVSASYVLPADKIATVKVGSTTVVEMHNELRDTPKTGDNSNVGLWTALAGLSALGIVGTAIIAYRKKKKEDNE